MRGRTRRDLVPYAGAIVIAGGHVRHPLGEYADQLTDKIAVYSADLTMGLGHTFVGTIAGVQ